jgi:hypothetical protein
MVYNKATDSESHKPLFEYSNFTCKKNGESYQFCTKPRWLWLRAQCLFHGHWAEESRGILSWIL